MVLNKRRQIVVFIIGFLVLIGIAVYSWLSSSKPSTEDFVALMEEKYSIECQDEECTSFNIEVHENGENKTIHMLSHSGATSERATYLLMEKYYFSEWGSTYFLRIKVKGALGEFNIIEEDNNIKQN